MFKSIAPLVLTVRTLGYPMMVLLLGFLIACNSSIPTQNGVQASGGKLQIQGWPVNDSGRLRFYSSYSADMSQLFYVVSVGKSGQLEYQLPTPTAEQQTGTFDFDPANTGCTGTVTVTPSNVKGLVLFSVLAFAPIYGEQKIGQIIFTDIDPNTVNPQDPKPGLKEALLFFFSEDIKVVGTKSCLSGGNTGYFEHEINAKKGWNYITLEVLEVSANSQRLKYYSSTTLPPNFKWHLLKPKTATTRWGSAVPTVP